MVHLSILKAAAAILSLNAVVSALPEMKRQAGELKKPMGVPNVPASAHPALFSGPEIEHVELSLEGIEAGATAPPSAGVAAAAALAARAAAGGEEDKRGIIGVDNRQIPPNSSYPFNTMGKFVWSTGSFCSASLIGPRHVVTAKHCTPPSGTGARFIPYSFGGGEPFGSAAVTLVFSVTGTPTPVSCEYKEDWAVFVLDTRLGDSLGYLGANYISDQYEDQPIFNHLGYPGDLNSGLYPYWQSGVTVRSGSSYVCGQYGPLETDVDAMSGQSGGPLWLEGTAYLYGVASVTNDAITLFASGDTLINTIISARSLYP